MKRFQTAAFFVASNYLATVASAQSIKDIKVTPSSGIFDGNNVSPVAGDSAPGFEFGSLKSNGVAETDMYFTPTALFDRISVTLGDVASFSYFTKKGSLHVDDNLGDWYIVLYTEPYVGDVSSGTWYGDRINTNHIFQILWLRLPVTGISGPRTAETTIS